MGLINPASETSLIEALVRNIEQQAGLATKVDFIMTGLEKQTARLDTLITAVTRMEEKQAQTNIAVESVSRTLNDHEARLRVAEPKIVRYEELERDHEELKRAFEAYKTETTDKLDSMGKTLTRILAGGAVALIVLEFIINTFVEPWVSSLLAH